MKYLLIICLSILTSIGHSTTSNTNTSQEQLDPLEEFNRQIFTFNKVVDKHIFHPITTVYKDNAPTIMQKGVNNFFSNLGDIPTLGNQLLQFKFTDSLNTLMRIIFNTTFGMGGIANVASEIGLEQKKEDFGQTLGYYGVPSGPYIVLPILGPSSLRDVMMYPADKQMSADLNQDTNEGYTTTAFQAINISSNVMPITKAAYQDQDPYIKIRSSYLQNREYEINDGVITTIYLDF